MLVCYHMIRGYLSFLDDWYCCTYLEFVLSNSRSSVWVFQCITLMWMYCKTFCPLIFVWSDTRRVGRFRSGPTYGRTSSVLVSCVVGLDRPGQWWTRPLVEMVFADSVSTGPLPPSGPYTRFDRPVALYIHKGAVVCKWLIDGAYSCNRCSGGCSARDSPRTPVTDTPGYLGDTSTGGVGEV